jgi:3-isopropylmalate/(R)-2-methylmalate dehydratase large subunit
MEEYPMGKTIVEKILGQANTQGPGDSVRAGDIVNARISYLMTNDAVGELTARAFDELGTPVFDSDRVAVILDHYIPASSENAARVHHLLRGFARTHGLHLFDQIGVCHQIMLESFVAPGDIVIGTDSHTCTYGGIGAFATGVGSTDGAAAMATGELWLKVPESIRVGLVGRLQPHVSPKDIVLNLIGKLGSDGATYKALEFSGDGARAISNEGRFTICNMAIEAGAKTGLFGPDAETTRFTDRTGRPGVAYQSDGDADYCATVSIDLNELTPQVARPWSVDNVVPASNLSWTRIDQAFVGSCTNGRVEDLRVVASILDGGKVHDRVRLLVTPASQAVYRQAVSEGLVEVLVDAGAIICNPGCSACFGGQGMLWDGEVCIGTHNRNFRGRMGHKDSQVYLASPETVARSALAGSIDYGRE